MIDVDLDPARDVAFEVHLPAGLPGFPRARRFRLRPYRAEAHGPPLLALEPCEEPGPAFVAVTPWAVDPGYRFVLDAGQRRRLGLRRADDALVLCLVTLVEPPEESTVNLAGPLVVNPLTHEGAQVPARGYPLAAALTERP